MQQMRRARLEAGPPKRSILAEGLALHPTIIIIIIIIINHIIIIKLVIIIISIIMSIIVIITIYLYIYTQNDQPWQRDWPRIHHSARRFLRW